MNILFNLSLSHFYRAFHPKRAGKDFTILRNEGPAFLFLKIEFVKKPFPRPFKCESAYFHDVERDMLILF